MSEQCKIRIVLWEHTATPRNDTAWDPPTGSPNHHPGFYLIRPISLKSHRFSFIQSTRISWLRSLAVSLQVNRSRPESHRINGFIIFILSGSIAANPLWIPCELESTAAVPRRAPANPAGISRGLLPIDYDTPPHQNLALKAFLCSPRSGPFI